MHPDTGKRPVGHSCGRRDQARAKLRNELAMLGDNLEVLIRHIDATEDSLHARVPVSLRDDMLVMLLQVRSMGPASDPTPEFFRHVGRQVMLLNRCIRGEAPSSEIELRLSSLPGVRTN